MSMEKEWKELKAWLDHRQITISGTEVLAKMTELERSSLPERVAKILRQIKRGPVAPTDFGQMCAFETIARALETSDLSELEKWQKK